MRARLAGFLAGEAERLAREESGVALLLTLAVFLLLYILCCGVYATGELIRQKTEVQNACDAAAYSAAVVQADALSRMAVVNRAMAWTYIQLCREQMDYITFAWLKLTCKRFNWDKKNKAKMGGIADRRHFTFKGYDVDGKLFGAGLHCVQNLHEDLWYIGVGDGNTVKEDCVALNGRNSPNEAKPVEEIEEFLDEIDDQAKAVFGKDFRAATRQQIEQAKLLIPSMNATLVAINRGMHDSVKATVPYVLFNNLPRTSDGQLDEEEVKDYYWMMGGGLSPNPEAYSGLLPPSEDGEDPSGSYFSGLGNTEGDELQFLTMADGIPGRKEGAPGWMKGRPVRLSDYFGTEGMEAVDDSDGSKVYMAGGLDQWYVRGTEKEAMSGQLHVPKDVRDPPGGIMRVYKHTNREEGATEKFGLEFSRPNHIFAMNLESKLFGQADILSGLLDFGNPFGELNKYLGDLGKAAKKAIQSVVGQVLQSVMGPLNSVIGGFGGVIGQLGGLDQFSADILPSDRHLPEKFPDQCLHVSSSTGLVAQYEWSSAYWMCPWVKIWGEVIPLGHYRLPVSALFGCSEHGYKPWVSKEIEVLGKGGATRSEYRSCFINFDDMQTESKNHYLKGYARIYGDDAEIFDEDCYIGALACPWVLSKTFFHGDGTILVGLARKQKNPFLRLLAKGVGVDRPSIYEPFSPQEGSDKFVVALSAARAAWAPRPDKPVTGMETMNDGRPPGNYEPRFDEVTEHKFGFQCPCGEDETEDRLLRMWNLSQTDWDATLLPLRHAFAGHLPYDSYVNLTDGSAWEYQDERTNAVVRLTGLLHNLRWVNGLTLVESQLPGKLSSEGQASLGQARSLSTDEIISIPQAVESDGKNRGSLYQMLLYRRLL